MPRLLPTCPCCLLGLILVIGSSGESHALRKRPTWNVRTSKLPDAKAGGWFINLGITGARAKILPGASRVLEVTYVFEKTPAFGKLEIGDKITGANGKAFVKAHRFGSALDVFGYEGPMMDFGNALEESQGRLGGRLALDVLRGGTKKRVVLDLPAEYGAFSASYPYDCKKTERILEDLYAYLLVEQRPDGLWHSRPHINVFAALALLAVGNDAHLPAARRAAKALARATTDRIDHDGLDCWKYGLYGIYLAEYYLITRERWVLPELEQINQWLHKAQLSSGGWGHQPAYQLVDNGYGGINVITMQAKMAWALMMRCGLNVDEAKLRATHEFVGRGTNRIGYVWYKDGGRDNPWYADMGRTGASAIAHYLTPSGGELYRRVALSNARCIGHFPATFPDTRGSPLLGIAWTALGALPDPAMFRKLLDHNRWHFALAQCPEGTFYYQPNRDNSPQDYVADPRLCASAVTALILSVKHKRLQLTGAERLRMPPAVIEPVVAKRVSVPVEEPARKPARKPMSLPGLKIDVRNRCVDIDATVCLDQGSLELVACTKGSKEHESIVAVDARPMHIHTALLLLGANNGNPAMRKQLDEEDGRWVDLPPGGDPIDAYLVFKNSEGNVLERPVSDFVAPEHRRADEIGVVENSGEEGKAEQDNELSHEFLFAGSQLLDDGKRPRRYLADMSGHVISIATFGDELLCLPGVRNHAIGALLWRVDSTHLPGVGSKVTLRLRPKRAREK